MSECRHEWETYSGPSCEWWECQICNERIGLSEVVDQLREYEAKVSDQQRRIDALEKALLDAIESYDEYSQYAGEYLCKKHRVAEHIQELRELLPTAAGRVDQITSQAIPPRINA